MGSVRLATTMQLGDAHQRGIEPKAPRLERGAFPGTPTTHALRIYAQQMHSLHRLYLHRDAKSALSGWDLPLPKLNVEGSIPFTRFIEMLRTVHEGRFFIPDCFRFHDHKSSFMVNC